MTLLTSLPTLECYDLVVVGSGNGACAFLRQYLATNPDQRVLVLEEWRHFFDTSEITHQRNWTQAYAEGDIFLLHDAQTPDGLPILSGRACTMGGGGSINYTMIYESSAWLSQNFGHGEDYWNARKQELAEAFQLLDPPMLGISLNTRKGLVTSCMCFQPSSMNLASGCTAVSPCSPGPPTPRSI